MAAAALCPVTAAVILNLKKYIGNNKYNSC